MWPKIFEFQPQASLHIYCDIDGKWVNQVQGEMMNKIRQLFSEYGVTENKMNIYYHGWVNKKVLADAWLSSDIWFYPCTFMETFCLTALEAALTKTLVITNNLAALQNTVGHRGVIIKGDVVDSYWQERALLKIKKYLDPENIEMKNEFIEINYEWASTLSWASQAKKLLNEHILQEKLEYKGIYNWTNNFPFGQKQIFLEAIEYFKNNIKNISSPIKVLEIGTHTGISLINIIKLIPNSIGIGIEKWSSSNLELESSFYKNILIEGLEDKIKGIKGDSNEILFEMLIKKDFLDFIYINGNQKSFDYNIDLFQSWKILNRGGLLVIDIHSFNEDINHFINKYQNEIEVLHKGHVLFLIKNKK